MNKFQFYPTPYDLADLAASLLQNRQGLLLEPSAGHGDLLSGLSHNNRWRVTCVEMDPDNCAVLNAPDENRSYEIQQVIQGDFLTIEMQKIYDAVLMNPPFADGVKHVLKAWNLLKQGGELVAILNAETLNNDFSAERRLLGALVEKMGHTMDVGSAFKDAEIKTGVKCSIIYLKKPEAMEEFDFSAGLEQGNDAPVFNTAREDKAEAGNMVPHDFVANAEADYRRGLEFLFKGLDQFQLGFQILDARFGKAYNCYEKIDRDEQSLHGCIEKSVSKITDLTELPEIKNTLVSSVRALAWLSVLDKTEAAKLIYSSDREKFTSEVMAGTRGVSFTQANIKAFLLNIFNRRQDLFKNAVKKLFDELRRYHKENAVYTEGWKTNKSWHVPEKVILPRGVERYFGGSFRISYGKDYLDDLDAIIRVLDCKAADYGTTIKKALQQSFDQPGNTAETEYFFLRYFLKGTLHITFKRLDLLKQINVIGTDGKTDLPNMRS